jgi:septum formation protein
VTLDPIVLASASPRRAEILSTLGIPHRVAPADVDESPFPAEDPVTHVERLARAKAEAVAARHPGEWVLAGDTVVVVDGELLGKPVDEAEAVAMLLRLQGRGHEVASGLALVLPSEQWAGASPSPSGASPSPSHGSPGSGAYRVLSGVEITQVRFRTFGRATAEGYAATGEPLDKAGAYGIQGLGSILVEGIRGDYSNVVGLPVPLLVRLLERGGRPYRFPSSGRPGSPYRSQ